MVIAQATFFSNVFRQIGGSWSVVCLLHLVPVGQLR